MCAVRHDLASERTSTVDTESPRARGMRPGEYLRWLREERGLSQKRLAELAGVGAGWVSEVETGKRKRPGPEGLRALARALQVEEAELLGLYGYLPTTTRVVREEPVGDTHVRRVIEDASGVLIDVVESLDADPHEKERVARSIARTLEAHAAALRALRESQRSGTNQPADGG